MDKVAWRDPLGWDSHMGEFTAASTPPPQDDDGTSNTPTDLKQASISNGSWKYIQVI